MAISGWALVTGASAGIGEGMVRSLAKRGWKLVLVARNEEALERVAAHALEMGAGEVRVIPLDLTSPDAPLRLEEELVGLGVNVDLLVNNAGFGDFGSYLELGGDREQAMITLNVAVLVELSRRFGARMAMRGKGRILNVASTAAFQPGPLMTTYYATKAFVLSYSEGLRNELGEFGVSVTTLCPGPTRSEFQRRSGMTRTWWREGNGLPEAQEVAEFGVRAALAGRGVAVHGWRNRMAVVLLRLIPRSSLPGLVRKIQEQRR